MCAYDTIDMRSWNPSSSPKPCVLFVKAEWCGHCKAAKPEMEKASRLLGSVIPMFSVDADSQAALVQKLGVQGFPTILFMPANGPPVTYNGARTAQGVVDWVCRVSSLCAAGRRP